MDARFERQARNEALMREVNERIDAIAQEEAVWDKDGFLTFLCECGREGGCHATVQMTAAEYDQVRTQDDRFAVYPGHQTPGLENVVAGNERWVLVDKVAEAEPFVEDDPRGAPSH
jgi:hypothetical protein